MKTSLFLIFVVLAGGIGASLGYIAHHQRYGQYNAKLGAYDLSGTVTPANIQSHFKMEAVGSGPQIEVSEDGTHDFGKLPVHAASEHTFTITNTGDEPLEIEIGDTTCKCTMGELEQDSLGPGESTEVKLSWTIETLGETFGQQANLITNDPRKPNFPLRIVGRVTRDFELEPKAMAFGTVTSNDSIDTRSRLHVYAKDNFRLTGINELSRKDLNGLAKIQVTPVPDGEIGPEFKGAIAAYDIDVHIEPGVPQGVVSENVLIGFERDDTESPLDEFITIPLQGAVEGELRMLLTSKLKRKIGGGYMFLIGKVPADVPYEGTGLVVLRGEERNETKLKIESVYPENIVSASIGEPKVGKNSTLIPVNVKLNPTDKTADYFGLAGDDNSYGRIVIAADKEDGAKMVLYLKFKMEVE